MLKFRPTNYIRCFCAYVLFLFCVVSPTALVATPEEQIRIGAILMLTGDQAVYGKALLEGIELATDEINTAGGINGKRLSIIVEDSQLSPKVANAAAVKMISHDRVPVALNASFIETMANGKVFESAKVPVITLWDSAKEIEGLGDYVFGIGIWAPSSAKRAADFAAENLNAKTAVVIYLQAEWSETVAGLFEEYFQARGGSTLKRFSLVPSTTDFRTVLQKAKSLKPDLIYCPLTENILPFYKQLREVKFQGHVVTSDIIAVEHISQSPKMFDGIYQTNAPDPNSPIANHMQSLYVTKHGTQPKLPMFVAWGYDGVRILADALRQVGSDSAKIKEHLYNLRAFPGASAAITFNAEGSSPVMEKMFRIRDGGFELLDK